MDAADIVDLRTALEAIKGYGELVEIEREIDPHLDLTALINALGRKPNSPALYFKKIKGSASNRAAANMVATRSRLARLLGMPHDQVEFKKAYMKAMLKPLKPQITERGPIKDNIVLNKGDDFDITRIISPVIAAKKSHDRYYQPIVITKHPLTGERNAGLYRACVQGPGRVTSNILLEKHGGMHLKVAMDKGETFPVALVMGVDPAIYNACAAKLPYGYDELELAGALRGRPVEMVRCETVPLEVPSTAEIVIEGQIRPPYERGSDGPWPEFHRYLGMQVHPPVIDITAVTFRDNPINYIFLPGTREISVTRMGGEIYFYKMLKEFAGEFVLDATLTPGSGTWHHGVIKVNKSGHLFEGLQFSTALAAFNFSPYLDMVIVVDEDVDIYDYEEIDWAICTRCNPASQIHMLGEGRAYEAAPICGVRELTDKKLIKGKVIIDATIPWELKVKEKAPGITFFTKSEFADIDPAAFLSPEDSKRWLS